ncbi:hypothetical protein RIR_jg12547.t1 [Rhizophagus irregularis DAOM 181602=DAOM 197198]|nr:hypothetical protein RIR_jg12547.t1 [Rhizophagus irregularis DAOM 181602=DAOM 197198]
MIDFDSINIFTLDRLNTFLMDTSKLVLPSIILKLVKSLLGVICQFNCPLRFRYIKINYSIGSKYSPYIGRYMHLIGLCVKALELTLDKASRTRSCRVKPF